MKTEPEQILEIIKQVKVYNLGNWDGCSCSSFSLRNVDFDICCGKGRDRGLYISSVSGDYANNHDNLLRPVAEEVAKQVEEADHRGPLPIYYHEWKRNV